MARLTKPPTALTVARAASRLLLLMARVYGSHKIIEKTTPNGTLYVEYRTGEEVLEEKRSAQSHD